MLGIDLVSLADLRRGQGRSLIVNGQKIWTSYADKADWIFCLVRTDKDEASTRASASCCSTWPAKGVSTKPILLISGNSPFCETFFDDVEVPKAQSRR
jgi:acyl-CoA dehydrogenase